GDAEGQGITQIDAVALVVAPDRQQHVGHYHHQCGALRHLLIKAEEDAQRGNGAQPATDAEQPADRAEQHTENHIEEEIEELHGASENSAAMLATPLWSGNRIPRTMALRNLQRQPGHESGPTYPSAGDLPRCAGMRQLFRRRTPAPADAFGCGTAYRQPGAGAGQQPV